MQTIPGLLRRLRKVCYASERTSERVFHPMNSNVTETPVPTDANHSGSAEATKGMLCS